MLWWQKQLILPQRVRDVGVYDRCFWLSEPIYIAVTGRKSECPTQQLWRGINDLWAENPYIIFCMTDLAVMRENTYAAGRPRNENTDPQRDRSIDFLYWAFFGIWSEASDRVWQYDYNQLKADDALHWLARMGF